ncbi:MAG TPA: ATP-binding protein [Anaeromyxobacter sp.]|nr:ATP-binding protein [Anaeromyxobacter sp.]
MKAGRDPEEVPALLEAVFERAGVGLCVVGPRDEVVRANRRWLRAAQAPAARVVGRDVLAPLPRSWRVRALLARARRGGPVALPPLRRGGATWRATAAALRVAGGAGLLLTLAEGRAEARGAVRAREAPISARRAATRARGPREEPLLRALADAMPQVVCALAPDGTPEYVNPAWTEFSGLDLAASAERGWLGVVHPDDVAPLRETWRRARVSGRPEQVELRYRAADGGYRWFLSRLAPVRDVGGRVVRWIGAGIDIDERRRAEAEREGLLARVEEADRRKTEFLGVLSHELRNPLAPLRNAAYVLSRAPAGGEQARAAVGVIGRQVEQLARLVDDLLDVTRIARGKVQLRRRKVDLGNVACRTAEDHRTLLAERGVSLEVAAPTGPLWVNADATRLAQVIGNLLGNAAKFTDAGGRVALTVTEEGGRGVVRVADTGIGMPPGMLARVFEPFVQVENARHAGRGGLGLGLALVKGLVELHGGTVEARSAGEGRGAEFVVALPLLGVDEIEAPTPPPVPLSPARRVLVVEDNRDSAEMLRLVLELDGHEVEVAASAADAVARTRAFLPDVVLCDIGLPDRDGYEVARDIRALPELAGVRLVALTGHALPEDQRRASEAGFEAHLGKPVSPEELERVLRVMGPPAS